MRHVLQTPNVRHTPFSIAKTVPYHVVTQLFVPPIIRDLFFLVLVGSEHLRANLVRTIEPSITSHSDVEKPSAARPDEKKERRDPVAGMEFVWVPGYCYWMGQTSAEKRQLIQEWGDEKYEKYYKVELPRHEVCVDGFWL